MIIPEHILEGIFEQMPTVHINDTIGAKKPNFGYGDRFELVKYLLKTGEESYPLIWLLSVPGVTDELHTDNGHLCMKLCDFIIATRETRKELLASERFKLSFKYVLSPVVQHVDWALKSSQTTRVHNYEGKIGRFTDYSYEEAGLPGGDGDDSNSVTIDMWDAIRYRVRVEFNNNCQNPIKWKTITP